MPPNEDDYLDIYIEVPSGPWILMKRGEQILTGTYVECILWLTQRCPRPILQSALEQGYHIEPTTVGGNPPCKSVSS